ncbi:Polyadenylate-binding protein, cytoplasmic and nuclear [Liparis tanakae]|uniref:Polyadenylate-binding protein, cytoplasmic and nuclear n=1 Tax=Liparis tanakae TaxID=230148 RepID=A0A4Z2GQI3_9TELE|nr:Polyadenylate-binding protein, cytoplasmic and nuclear [Liparis tanakae]
MKLTMRRSFLYLFLLMMCLTLLRVAREFLLMVIFSTVPCKDVDNVSVSSDSLGEQLFELVDVLNTGHAQKITDPKLLGEQVNFALKTLKEQNTETDTSDTSDADDTERLGEKIFSLVDELDPLHANDITGMMLEMDPAALHQLLGDHAMLQAAVQKARAALDTRSQTPEEHSNILHTE